MVEFKIAKHSVRKVEVVEIYVDGVFRATLYPQEPNAVRLISTHLASRPQPDPSPDTWRFVFLPS